MAIPIVDPSNDLRNFDRFTGTETLVPASAVLSSRGFKTVRDAMQDPILKGQMLDVWKSLIGNIEEKMYLGTPESGVDVVSGILEYPKILLEHQDFMDTKLNPYFKEVQAIKLPFPKVVVVTGSPFDRLSGLAEKMGKSIEDLDLGDGDLRLFWSFVAVQKESEVIGYVPLIDPESRLRIFEFGMLYGELPTGEPRDLINVPTYQNSWVTKDRIAHYVRLVSETVFMMTLNPNTTQAYVSIPTDKEIAVNKKRLRNNKKPMIEFKLITIDGKKKDTLPSVPQGTHAPPKQHWRRGHWRHYSSGKTVFINPMLVGDEKNGKIIKDYAVGIYEDRGHERRSAHPA